MGHHSDHINWMFMYIFCFDFMKTQNASEFQTSLDI